MLRRPAATVVTATVASSLMLTAACSGGGSTAAEQQPVGASTSPASPSQSPPATEPAPRSEPSSGPPTPTTPPLSRFESEPPVVAARAWAAAVARAINKRERDLAGAQRFMTRAGQERFPRYTAEDVGQYFPGPQPFTPTQVTVHGRQAAVELCWWSYGFAQDRKTKLPADKRRIAPGRLTLRKQGGRWLVDNLVMQDGDCSKVPVKGVGW